MPMDPGRNRPAERSSHTRLNASIKEKGLSPIRGITAQLAWKHAHTLRTGQNGGLKILIEIVKIYMYKRATFNN